MSSSLTAYPVPSLFIPEYESDVESQTTLEDDWPSYTSGAPLTRMVPLEYWEQYSEESNSDDEEAYEYPEYVVREEDINYIEEDFSFSNLILREESFDGEECCVQCSSPEYAQQVVNHFAANESSSMTPRLALYATPSHPTRPLLIRHIPFSSYSTLEVAVWRFLNDPTLRRDPWNPAPPALLIEQKELENSSLDRLAHIIESGDVYGSYEGEAETYIVMDGLTSIKDNPLNTDHDWIDFIRQMLQSLVFLHENNVTHGSFTFPEDKGPRSIMMDIGMAPRDIPFSRQDYPVKYYLLDYSKAVKLRVTSRRQLSPVGRFSVSRGRSRNPVRLSASRTLPYQAPTYQAPKTTQNIINAVEIKSQSVHRPGRRRSRLPILSDRYASLEDAPLHMAKRWNLVEDGSQSDPAEWSDPEYSSETESEDFSSTDEEVFRIVTPAARATLFAADMKSLANMLSQIIPKPSPLFESLSSIFGAMMDARTTSLTASAALELFERGVRETYLR
ncbi:hypothetical protein M422DRAFT_240823 [Sphaerobolus stellatus SS14]|nr:hypothetical protein M422DRAFT_240823 [Sphaerobolus stellatus SS14]